MNNSTSTHFKNTNDDKVETISDINKYYKNHEEYKVYLELALEKYEIQYYSFKKDNHKVNIIKDNELRSNITNLLIKETITNNDFNEILGKLSNDQLCYIGI